MSGGTVKRDVGYKNLVQYVIEVRITCVVNIAYTTREPLIFCSRSSVYTDCILFVVH